MSPRHISPQSFDDILSELGDDPAIPDPHGIRKSPTPPKTSRVHQEKSKSPSLAVPDLRLSELKNTSILAIGLLFLLTIVTLYFLLENSKASTELELNALKGQISTVKNELSLAQSNWLSEQEELYYAMDEIEVSIHSKELKNPTRAPQSKPIAIPYEAELRRWRYLGHARIGETDEAFFHTGKATLTVGKEGLALGEWRLAQAVKAMAILTHPTGKSITLKSTKSE